jgi:hypothetical protein
MSAINPVRRPPPYQPPKIEPSKEAIQVARRAIDAGKVFEFVSGQLDFKDDGESDDWDPFLNSFLNASLKRPGRTLQFKRRA